MNGSYKGYYNPNIILNPILTTDSYKPTHWYQERDGVTYKHFYEQARYASPEKPMVWFGNQYVISDLQEEMILGDIVEAKSVLYDNFDTNIVFNEEGFQHIVKDHGGKWPVRIYALPEGTIIRDNRPLLTIENTCPQCFWVPGYLETKIEQNWYPSSVASTSFEVMRMFKEFEPHANGLTFKLHDFGLRGATSMESGAIGGMAHLTVFDGTDNLPALEARNHYYPSKINYHGNGKTIQASEHSIATIYGEAGEEQYIRRLLITSRTKMVSIVIDSYDTMKCLDLICGFKDTIIGLGITVVVRPDSGQAWKLLPQILQRLDQTFGSTMEYGLKVLNPSVRVIWGDGMKVDTIRQVLTELSIRGWSLNNLAFGMGGGLLQNVTRDSFGFTIKCSAFKCESDEWQPAHKNSPGKISFAGPQTSPDMELVYEKGEVVKYYSWEEVRDRIADGLTS